MAMERPPLADAPTNVQIVNLSNSNNLGAAKPVAPAKTTKRKAWEIQEPQALPEIESDDERLQYITENCDQIRRKIRNFINTGEMKVTEFQKAIATNSTTYGRFMGQNGADKGSGSTVYHSAFVFFKKRELQGVKAPKKKKVTKAEEQKKNDVSDIHLDGESEVDVPVYDTCDEARKKINAYLREPGVTQAGFLREIAKTYPDGKKIQSKVLNDFLNKKGPNAGNTSSVFYASYVYFEKMRLRDGKPKSKFREEMEGIWNGKDNGGKPGFDVKHSSNRGFWCRADERPHEDKYGRIEFY